LWVLDANKAIVVTPGVTNQEFSQYAVDLRAQTTGAVSSYSWNTSQAPDATNVSGASTYRLQFTWATFTGSARTDTISLTTTFADTTQITQSYTFQVTSNGSPAWSSTPPTTSSTWPSLETPDQVKAAQAAVAAPFSSLRLATGELDTVHALPAYNPGLAPLSLVYSSAAANPQPVFVTHFTIDPTQAVPPTVSAQLTFNSVAGSTFYYNTASLNPGDVLEIALQGNAASLPTGRYTYQLAVTANYGTPVTTTYSGSVDIVNSQSSPFGAGWSLSNYSRLWPVTGGVILELPCPPSRIPCHFSRLIL
jgi:hypothetical protein